ncbi:trigger factor [Ruminobacter amylophilus]|uniref:Trigger factor n=1 Tax=Ruminobacter amylophilus TaxID=867 RepID=A0A662ZIJ2_9GAMM|nr:trigger factor [Ruminobacter amylophilus]SFP54783.1 trigger factor [Ruminobacter amylophilus]
MQVSVESSEGLERKIKVVIPAEEYKNTYYKVVRKIGKTNRIPGFRKGKVPDDVVIKQFGYQVKDESVNELISKSMYQALNEAKIENLADSMPLIENIEDTGISNDFAYTFSVEVYPVVDLSEGVDTVEFKKVVGQITDEDINKMIDTLCRQQGSWEASEAEIAKENLVRIDFEGFKDGQSIEKTKAQNYPIIVGSNRMIPGFEDQLLGHKVNDEFEFNITFPADYHAADLAGQEVLFKVKVNEVMLRKPAELNDELVKSFGVEGGVDAFRADVKKNMERELNQVVFRENSDEVISKLIAKYGNIELPSREVENMFNNIKKNQKDADEAKLKESCANMIKQKIIIGAVCRKYNITPSEERVNAFIDSIASAYDQADEFKKALAKNPEQLNNIRNRAMFEQIVDEVLAKGKVTEENKSFYELVNHNF